MLDRVIRAGVVIDGTGAPRRSADVGIRDGRIVAIGQIDEPARESLDADGAIVRPTLGTLAFADHASTLKLNAIVHE